LQTLWPVCRNCILWNGQISLDIVSMQMTDRTKNVVNIARSERLLVANQIYQVANTTKIDFLLNCQLLLHGYNDYQFIYRKLSFLILLLYLI
jgi:hypothetical protein